MGKRGNKSARGIWARTKWEPSGILWCAFDERTESHRQVHFDDDGRPYVDRYKRGEHAGEEKLVSEGFNEVRNVISDDSGFDEAGEIKAVFERLRKDFSVADTADAYCEAAAENFDEMVATTDDLTKGKLAYMIGASNTYFSDSLDWSKMSLGRFLEVCLHLGVTPDVMIGLRSPADDDFLELWGQVREGAKAVVTEKLQEHLKANHKPDELDRFLEES